MTAIKEPLTEENGLQPLTEEDHLQEDLERPQEPLTEKDGLQHKTKRVPPLESTKFELKI